MLQPFLLLVWAATTILYCRFMVFLDSNNHHWILLWCFSATSATKNIFWYWSKHLWIISCFLRVYFWAFSKKMINFFNFLFHFIYCRFVFVFFAAIRAFGIGTSHEQHEDWLLSSLEAYNKSFQNFWWWFMGTDMQCVRNLIRALTQEWRQIFCMTSERLWMFTQR